MWTAMLTTNWRGCDTTESFNRAWHDKTGMLAKYRTDSFTHPAPNPVSPERAAMPAHLPHSAPPLTSEILIS